MPAFGSWYPRTQKGEPTKVYSSVFHTFNTAGAQFHLGIVAAACVTQLLVLSLGGPRPFGVTVIILTRAVAAPSCWLSPDMLNIPLLSRSLHQSSKYGCVPLVVGPQVLALAIPQ